MTAPVEDLEQEVDATAAPANLIAKVVKAIAAAGEVVKDKENTEHHYKFASVESMLKAVRDPLYAEGVLLQVQPREFVDDEVTARSGSKGSRVIVEVDFTFTDGYESFTIERWRGEAIDYSDKAYGKAYTNAIKTFIRAQWLLPADDDTDGDRQSPERGATGGAVPSWASPLDQGKARELFNQLEVLVGAEYAKTLMGEVKQRTEIGIPAMFLPFAKAIAEHQLEAPTEQLEEQRDHARAVAAGDAEPTPAPEEPDAVDPAESDVPPDMEGLESQERGALDGEPDLLFDGDGS